MKKSLKKNRDEPENHDRWLVSYADFITLLFAFFVVMFATSQNDSEKQKEFEKSVRVNLKLSANPPPKASAGAPDADAIIAEYLPAPQGVPSGAHVPSGIDVPSGTEKPEAEKFPAAGGSVETADYAQRYLSKNFSKDEIKALGLQVNHDAVGVRVTLAASSVFPAGEFKMKRTSLTLLNQLGDLLQRTDRKILIEGHTDDLPVKSAQGVTNWELASLRATSMVRYLIKTKGLDPKRMAAISYADQKPLVPNLNEENRAKNRRIEILILSHTGN